MPTSQAFFDWIQHTALSSAIRAGTSLFPWLESLHVLAITTVVGTIAVVDLRLVGLASRDRPASELMADILPLTRVAFALAVLTGSLLWVSNAWDYLHKAPFVAKLALLCVALLNIAVFHRLIVRDIQKWDTARSPPLPARLAGALSLAVWIGVVACGRWTGFV
jgi:hypothetical protein